MLGALPVLKERKPFQEGNPALEKGSPFLEREHCCEENKSFIQEGHSCAREGKPNFQNTLDLLHDEHVVCKQDVFRQQTRRLWFPGHPNDIAKRAVVRQFCQ